jgi:hypothetical protein
MVVIANTWMSIHTVTGVICVLKRTDQTFLALEAIWVGLLQHVERLLRGREQFLMVEGLCLVSEVLPSGYFLVGLWASDLQTRFYLCHASPPDDLHVWNGVMAVFWPWGEPEVLPRWAIEEQVQFDTRQCLAQGTQPYVLRYDPHGNAGGPYIARVANASTLNQLQGLLAVAFAQTARGVREAGTFMAGTVSLTVKYTRLSRRGDRWVWQVTIRAEDGARYFVLVFGPYLGIWDGMLSEL